MISKEPFLDTAGAALHDSSLKIVLSYHILSFHIHLILCICVAPLFIFYLTQAVLAPPALSQISSDYNFCFCLCSPPRAPSLRCLTRVLSVLPPLLRPAPPLPPPCPPHPLLLHCLDWRPSNHNHSRHHLNSSKA